MGYFLINPTVLYCLFKKSGAFEIQLFELFSIYGYSFSPFLIMVFFYLSPLALFRWILLAISASLSLYFLYSELNELAVKYFDQRLMKWVGLYLLATEVVLVFALKFYFLN